MRRHIPLLAVLLLICATGLGCELIASVDRSKIDGGGGAGGSTSHGTNSGSGHGGGGGGMPCTAPADCPTPANECVKATCEDGTCGTAHAPAGTPTASQTPRDCKQNQCDGKGAIVAANHDSDLPDDGNDCTDDVCTAGVPSHSNKAAATACGSSGGLQCDGSGHCVGCVAPADCGQDTDCRTWACTGGVCSSTDAAQGKLLGTQTTGDCQLAQCDGVGGVESVDDDTDVPVDGETCTQDVCTSGVPSNPPENAGTTCSEGTGTLCDGAGACAECVVASDCPGTDTECAKRACNAGVCGTSFTPSGTALLVQKVGDCQTAVCDGNGGTTSQDDDTDLPDDNNPCSTDLCNGGVASHGNVTDGTSCGSGALTCFGGTCSGCVQATDCPGVDDECKTRSCATGTCGFDYTANGVALATQIPGDCQQKVCDGAGNAVTIVDDTDVPADDGNACTNELCQAGTASHPAKPNNTPCSDGDACTQGDVCQAGTCTSGAPVSCTALDTCHTAGTCDSATGLCSNPVKADGAACNDGDACTQADACQAGSCVGGNPITCTASDTCHVAGACNPATGACSTPAAPNGTPCDDGSACTQTDTCQAGACVGGNPVTCTASDTCHVAGTCNPATGACSTPAAPNGTPCNDGDACTQTDTCQAGACVGGSPVTCSASDQCHVAGTCNPATGTCSNPAAPNGTGCNDGDACTQTDACQAGVCVGGNPITCAALDQCHVAGACNPGTGTCSNPNASDGTACTSGGNAGACESGSCATCFDGVPNGSETDVDCGGGTCAACIAGAGCGVNADCQSLVCLGNVCQATSCSDGVQNGTETGVDCGGSCPACPAVASITPVDGATNVAVTSTIAITFDTSSMSLATLTAQTSSGACSGSVQVSTDNFATCIGIGSTALAGATLTLTPAPGLSYGSTYAVKVTSAATDTSGRPCAPYTSVGFTTTALSATCSSGVVISQVYVGGGNASATYTNDFVELHNNGGNAVDIGNWAVGYETNAGATWTVSPIPAGTTIAAGGYVLIQEQGGATGSALPTPVIAPTTTFNLAAAQGKVGLATSAAAFSSQCPGLVDVVQWGSCTTACFEGTTFAPVPSNNTQSVTRKGLGCTDTNQNGTDFANAAVNPRTSTSTANACSCTLNESNQVLEADYCVIDSPTSLSVQSGTSTGAILGELFETGVTEGGASSWLAQVGYGPDDVNPEWQSGYTWFTATYVGQTGFSNHDNQFSGSFTAPAVGTYRYAYRFSSDGTNWTYCDVNGAGSNSNLSLEVTQLPILTSTP